jgi:serine acetyltransferase
LQKRVGAGASHADRADIRIGNDVWIGDRAMILPGVSIGDGAVIGGGSVVTKSVEPYEIWAGNPAKKIGERFTAPVAAALSALQWWNWSRKRVFENAEVLGADLATMSDDEALALVRELQEVDNAST